MKIIQINHFRTGQVLYEGRFSGMRQAVETAIRDRVALAFADLRHANLVNAALDGAILDGAQLAHANLLGANLCEASLHRTGFQNALMHSAALCESIIDAANFDGALFGATDIAGARLRHCLFSTLSALDLNFVDTAELSTNGFIADEDYLCGFSKPPLVIKGFRHVITCLDNKMLIGLTACAPEAPAQHHRGPLCNFMQTHREILRNLWIAHNGTPQRSKAA